MLGLGFVAPFVLAGLVALPVLWWLLRAIPPSPRAQLFPGVRLLLGLEDPEREAERTPWWLLLLRIVAIAAVIIGFAQPILNPSERLVGSGDGPVLVLMDAGWASAPDWEDRLAAASAAIDEAGREGRSVILWRAAEEREAPPPQMTPAAARAALGGSQPLPLRPNRLAVLTLLDDPAFVAPGETVWLHDGVVHAGEDADETAALAERLMDFGPLHMVGPAETARAVLPPRLEDGRLTTTVLRAGGAGDVGPKSETVVAIAAVQGEDGSVSGERRIAVAEASFEAGENRADATFDLPAELMGSVARLTLADDPSPGGTAIADGAVRRVRVAVVDPASEGDVIRLTSPRHYLTEALSPTAEVRQATLVAAIESEPAAIFLADQGEIAPEQQEALTAWLEEGGLLVRFAGPRLAGAIAANALAGNAAADDRLLPVRLRRGGRTLGGALAWGDPRTLGPFAPEGPFRRLERPEEVEVRTQVLAEPSPDLADRVWATLDDGTPLVTADERGEGHLVLFHVSADAEWSSLPISRLFVDMLRELLTLAPGRGSSVPAADELFGTLWRLERTLARDGTLLPVPANRDPVAGERLGEELMARGGEIDGVPPAAPGSLMPGLYARADGGPRAAGAAESLVVNLHGPNDSLGAFPPPPSGAVVDRLGGAESLKLAAPLLLAAVLLAAIDALATLWLSGRLPRLRRVPAAATGALALAIGLLSAVSGGHGMAQERSPTSTRDVSTAAETTLGYVVTGVPSIDRVSERALIGLGGALTARTAVEPGQPVGVDPERDELGLVSVLYMPLTRDTLPTDVALERLERYLAGGGLLLIDTKSGAAGIGGAAAQELRQVARSLNLPPLAPVDEDHVLTRTFYLLTTFPGRWRGGRVWAEAPPEGREAVEDNGLPQFDRVDDNVSPVVVGSADWASAWAVDERGRPMFSVGRPGDRQREMAIRFGVNLVLYALTGNYKSDQVHAPAVLERLGQ
ncbi:MAG: DUF4159 domain-containing protein [Pseudomonadota bacterium]